MRFWLCRGARLHRMCDIFWGRLSAAMLVELGIHSRTAAGGGDPIVCSARSGRRALHLISCGSSGALVSEALQVAVCLTGAAITDGSPVYRAML